MYLSYHEDSTGLMNNFVKILYIATNFLCFRIQKENVRKISYSYKTCVYLDGLFLSQNEWNKKIFKYSYF